MTLSALTPRDAEIRNIVRTSTDALRDAQVLVNRAHRLEVEANMAMTPEFASAKRATARTYRDQAQALSHEALMMQLRGSVEC